MRTERIPSWLGWLAILCSVTGISALGLLQHLVPSDDTWAANLPWPARLVILLLIVVTGAIWYLKAQLASATELAGGTVVSAAGRSATSKRFARATLRSLKIFAGDLSWLEEDLTVYRDLRTQRNVNIQILTDTPAATAIQAGKAHGIQFRAYPSGATAPLKASISDDDGEHSESRAFVVHRRTPRPGEPDHNGYGYWMKEYHGSKEYAVIKAMSELFDILFAQGEPL